MKEYVGTCIRCETPIYCEAGFLGGIVQGKGTIICFSCDKQVTDEKQDD